MNETEALNLNRSGQGVRYFVNLPGWDADEEVTYNTLVTCLRMDDAVDTEGYSDAEIFPDLIVRLLVDGTVEHAVWGVLS